MLLSFGEGYFFYSVSYWRSLPYLADGCFWSTSRAMLVEHMQCPAIWSGIGQPRLLDGQRAFLHTYILGPEACSWTKKVCPLSYVRNCPEAVFDMRLFGILYHRHYFVCGVSAKFLFVFSLVPDVTLCVPNMIGVSDVIGKSLSNKHAWLCVRCA